MKWGIIDLIVNSLHELCRWSSKCIRVGLSQWWINEITAISAVRCNLIISFLAIIYYYIINNNICNWSFVDRVLWQTSAPIGAWKCNSPPPPFITKLWKTDQLTDWQTDKNIGYLHFQSGLLGGEKSAYKIQTKPNSTNKAESLLWWTTKYIYIYIYMVVVKKYF